MNSQNKKGKEYVLEVPKGFKTDDEIQKYVEDRIQSDIVEISLKRFQKLPFTHFKGTYRPRKNHDRANFSYYFIHIFSNSFSKSPLKNGFLV